MVYLFHGPNDFSRAEKIKELCATIDDPTLADLNITSLSGRDLTLGQIQNVADALPFMAAVRVVIVTNYISQLKSQSSEMTQLTEYIRQTPPTTELIFAEDDSLRRNHPVLKAAAEIEAVVINFSEIDKAHLQRWITERAGSYGADIEPAAVDLLGRLVGPANLRLLNSELDKLALYVGGERSITPADVELLVPYVEDAENFGLANAIGQQNANRAYDQMRKLLDEGKHPMAILGSIAAQIRGLLEVKDMAERGLSPPEIARVKGWRSDYAAKMRLREASNFSIERLEAVLGILLDIDLEIKTGQIEAPLALDLLIARLCQA